MSAASCAHLILVTAGYGPVEVCRFVALLAARFEALCEDRGLVIEEAVVHGDEDAPRSVELHVRGDSSLLHAELGTHALVARSADRGRASRKRWYASVTLHPSPVAAEDASISLDPRDLEITATRASGPGGQNVNKTSTSVRVKHMPSGLIVRASDERSQKANIRRALARIASLLRARAEQKARAGETSRWSSHARLERGFPIRTYTLSIRGDLRVIEGS